MNEREPVPYKGGIKLAKKMNRRTADIYSQFKLQTYHKWTLDRSNGMLAIIIILFYVIKTSTLAAATATCFKETAFFFIKLPLR